MNPESDKELGIKEIFKREDSDFTPWLSKNLDKLESILDKGLEIEEIEKSVGPKRLDLLAKDENSNYIAIENQYGVSDFAHLGKILTYLVGSSAKEIVWIAEEFHQVHLDALEWLKKNKDKVMFHAISVVNPENNVEKNPEKIFFTKSKVYGEVKIGDVLDALNYEYKVEVDKKLKDLMEEYESENPNSRVVQNGVITGSFINWMLRKKNNIFENYFSSNRESWKKKNKN